MAKKPSGRHERPEGFFFASLPAASIQVPTGPTPNGLLVFGGLLIAWIGYGAVLESSTWQATFGKRVFGIRVYTADGGRMGFGQAAKRNVVKDGPFIVLGLIPGGQFLTIVWLLAHVVVIH